MKKPEEKECKKEDCRRIMALTIYVSQDGARCVTGLMNTSVQSRWPAHCHIRA